MIFISVLCVGVVGRLYLVCHGAKIVESIVVCIVMRLMMLYTVQGGARIGRKSRLV